MSLIARITRVFLVDIAKASEYHDQAEMRAFVEKLESRGLYTEATQDEIEEYDLIEETYYGQGY